MSIKNKIYVLGDSFSYSGCFLYDEYHFWVNELQKEYEKTHDLIVDAFISRDVQTIIDNWTKLLPNINENDILVIGIPFFIRLRVPLSSKDYMITKIDDFTITNRFITHHSWYTNDSQHIYVNDIPVEKKELDDKISFFERMYLDNESIEKNYNELIETLYRLSSCKKYLFSWDDMKYQTNVIEYKSNISKKIKWKTLDDLYNETNGLMGTSGDFHWHPDTQIEFGKYVIEKIKSQ